jgi:hypothetical protein
VRTGCAAPQVWEIATGALHSSVEVDDGQATQWAHPATYLNKMLLARGGALQLWNVRRATGAAGCNAARRVAKDATRCNGCNAVQHAATRCNVFRRDVCAPDAACGAKPCNMLRRMQERQAGALVRGVVERRHRVGTIAGDRRRRCKHATHAWQRNMRRTRGSAAC